MPCLPTTTDCRSSAGPAAGATALNYREGAQQMHNGSGGSGGEYPPGCRGAGVEDEDLAADERVEEWEPEVFDP